MRVFEICVYEMHNSAIQQVWIIEEIWTPYLRHPKKCIPRQVSQRLVPCTKIALDFYENFLIYLFKPPHFLGLRCLWDMCIWDACLYDTASVKNSWNLNTLLRHHKTCIPIQVSQRLVPCTKMVIGFKLNFSNSNSHILWV